MGNLTLPTDTARNIQQQFDELETAYPGLALSQDPSGLWIVEGNLAFKATFENMSIEDAFAIRLRLSPQLTMPPAVEETGGRIPKDFHKLGDGSLCLGAPIEVREKFTRQPKILSFVEGQVVPYLFSFSYWQKHGKMPYGERPHGGRGLLESYHDLFKVQNRSAVLRLLKLLALQSYRGHHICPCGSKIKLRNCHGPQFLKIKSIRTSDQFLMDTGLILLDLPKEEIRAIESDVLSKELLSAVKAVMSGRENTRKHA